MYNKTMLYINTVLKDSKRQSQIFHNNEHRILHAFSLCHSLIDYSFIHIDIYIIIFYSFNF